MREHIKKSSLQIFNKLYWPVYDILYYIIILSKDFKSGVYCFSNSMNNGRIYFQSDGNKSLSLLTASDQPGL